MVRSIVGMLVDVGLGKRSAGSLLGMLRARDRSTAGQLAPPTASASGRSATRDAPSSVHVRAGDAECTDRGRERSWDALFAEGRAGPYPYPVALQGPGAACR